MGEPLTPPKVLVINPTFRCTAQCRHCGTLSSPRVNDRLPLQEMVDAIDQAKAAAFRGVVFSGGEATLAGDDLLAAARRAALLGLSVRLITNAHWAATPQEASRLVDRFVTAGVSELGLSTGDQHVRFVPLEFVLHALRAAVEVGLDVALMIELIRERTITRESVEGHEAFQTLRRDFPHAPLPIIESPWMPLTPDRVQPYPLGVAVDRSNVDRTGGCPSALEYLSLFPDGSLAGCCGYAMRINSELKVGHLHTSGVSAAARAAEAEPLLRKMRVEGPFRVLAQAADNDPGIAWEGQYAHPCQACMRVYQDPRVRAVVQLA